MTSTSIPSTLVAAYRKLPTKTPSVSTIFIDESGHSGDLVKFKNDTSFNNQPIFALTGIGVANTAVFDQEFEYLCRNHKVQGEANSQSLRFRHSFVEDLTDLLCRSHLPFLIDVVNKRYQICIVLVSRMIFPSWIIPDSVPVHFESRMRESMIDVLYKHITNEVLQAYCAACNAPNRGQVRSVYLRLITWANEVGKQVDDVRSIGNCCQDLLDVFDGRPDFFEVDDALPIPDAMKNGSPAWIAAYYNCFTGLYSRINLLMRGRLEGITLLHDEQTQFRPVIEAAKLDLETYVSGGGTVLPDAYARYVFSEKAKLEFASSKITPGLQVADILGGYVTRYVQDGLFGKEPPNDRRRNMIQKLTDMARPHDSVAVRYVLPQFEVDRLGIPTSRGC
ncbi:MAG TPA: DUF3800 domain-containing protein [Tepidisphaeraceae bacterium]|nr:DUF3800 domain-containing protein [Tepidisphaeraceae bacterium]